MHVYKNFILVVHADDILIFSKKKLCVDTFVKPLAEVEENFELTDEVKIYKHLGVDMQTHSDGSYEIRKSYLAQRTTQWLKLSTVDSQK